MSVARGGCSCRVSIDDDAIAIHRLQTRSPGVVAAMMRPEIYRDHPRSIESRQTHISYVFLAGDYVYKIKKPVRFSFLDVLRSPGAINYVWTKYGLTGDSRQTSTWA